MDRIDMEEMLMWVVDYKYHESDNGIGTCEADISFRDEAERLKHTFEAMDKAEKKEVMCSLIEKVGYPCGDYADDFDDEDSNFGFECKWDDEKSVIHFSATFRI